MDMLQTKLRFITMSVVIIFLLIRCAQPNDPANANNEMGMVTGIVTLSDNQADVQLVTIKAGTAETHPDANGAYQLELTAGDHGLTASLAGYYSQSRDVTVQTDQTTDSIDFALTIIVEDHYKTIGFAMDLQVSDSLLYVAEDQAGFSVFNHVTDQKLSWFDNPQFENVRLIRVAESRNRLVIYNKYGTAAGIHVYDIADPAAPAPVFQIISQIVGVQDIVVTPLTNNNLGINWLNDDGSSRKYNYDGVLTPSNEWTSGFSFSFNFEVNGMDEDSDHLYIASEQMGLYICGNEWGETLGIVDTPGEALDVKVVDTIAYVADKTQGLSVIDVSDPTNPILLTSIDTEGYAQQIDVSDNYIAIASGGGGVYVFDRSAPTAPILLHHIDALIDYSYSVALKGDMVFAGTKSGVFKINIH